jgi:uracil-DNA glycosylase
MVPAMSADETTRKAAGRILAWYEAMGVDAALEERPLDWLARGEAAPGALFNVQTLRAGSGGAPATPPAARRAEMPGAPPRPSHAPAAPIAKPAR